MKSIKSFLCLSLFIFHFSFFTLKAQDAYMSMDTNKRGLFNDFIGIKLFAADFGTTNLNEDLQFHYVSDNNNYLYTFQHDFNVKGLNNMYNGGFGINENLGKHLALNFVNVSVGYAQNAWNWNLSAGAGYFVSLNRDRSLRLTAFLNIYYVNMTYSFGSYSDTTQLGFMVGGTNVGGYIRNVKYVNNIWSLSPGLELNFRGRNIDFFAGITYNYVFSFNEDIDFYYNRISVNQAIYDYSGNPISGNILNLNNYIIQVGIIREFGI